MEHETVHLVASGFELNAHVWRGDETKPILLLHGLGGNSVTWHGVAPLLARATGAHVLAVDLPGFGRSHPHGKRVGFAELSNVVAEIVAQQAASGARWHVAGNSLGGLLALELACRLPERISRLTLASAALPLAWGRGAQSALAIGAYVPAALPGLGRRLVAARTRSLGLPGTVDEPIRFLFGDASRLDPELRLRLIDVSAYRMSWYDEAARVLEQTTRSLGVALLRSDRAARWIHVVRCPVLNIYGNRDPLYPPSAWQRLARERPDWQHVLLGQIGHVPQLEAPVEFASRMLARERQLA